MTWHRVCKLFYVDGWLIDKSAHVQHASVYATEPQTYSCHTEAAFPDPGLASTSPLHNQPILPPLDRDSNLFRARYGFGLIVWEHSQDHISAAVSHSATILLEIEPLTHNTVVGFGLYRVGRHVSSKRPHQRTCMTSSKSHGTPCEADYIR